MFHPIVGAPSGAMKTTEIAAEAAPTGHCFGDLQESLSVKHFT
jgi:hypothetical protein